MSDVVLALIILASTGLVLGLALAFAAKIFAVKRDARIDEIKALLPGANCGGCGFAGCDAYATAVVEGRAKPSLCKASDKETIDRIASIAGVQTDNSYVRMRAQVMCIGVDGCSKPKYEYEGIADCHAVERMGGGTKICPNGCIGLGSCTQACKFDAISVLDGVAVIDNEKCTGCGMCTQACPKHIIKLIPYDSYCWVSCMSVDNGKITKSYCDAGCISCRICEKNCPSGAIKVNDFVASIDQNLCEKCGKCVDKCPRHIIRTNEGSYKLTV